MKLKRKITKQEFEQLADSKKELYVQSGEDYILDIEDTAFDTLKKEKADLKKELDDYKAKEEERIQRAEERARKKAEEEYKKAKTDKDVEAIEQSWSEKYNKLQSDFDTAKEKHSAFVKKSLIDSEVDKMANAISTNPLLIAPHIRSRLDVDLTGEEPKVIVLDTNGQRSALTLAELQKSFIDNKDFSAIIKATSANGGAKAKQGMSGTQQDKPKSLSEMTDQELADYAKAKYASEE